MKSVINSSRAAFLLAVVALTPALASCRGGYYWVQEKMGNQKRHLLSDRIKKANEGQQEAKQQFQTTLERFKALTNFEGGELEAKYKELNAQYERSEARADNVRSRITAIETVAADMFKEWQAEMQQISDPELRQSDQELFSKTEDRYNRLHDAMKKAEASMGPVLEKFKDRVTWLKHRLNASAIASLQGQVEQIESSVGALITDMEKSINEANEFIKTLEPS